MYIITQLRTIATRQVLMHKAPLLLGIYSGYSLNYILVLVLYIVFQNLHSTTGFAHVLLQKLAQCWISPVIHFLSLMLAYARLKIVPGTFFAYKHGRLWNPITSLKWFLIACNKRALLLAVLPCVPCSTSRTCELISPFTYPLIICSQPCLQKLMLLSIMLYEAPC